MGTFVLLGDTPGDPNGLPVWDPAWAVVDEEDPLLCLICVRDRGLGEDGQGVLYPRDDDDVVRGMLLDFLGHGKQRGLIQDTPPRVACMFRLHSNRAVLLSPLLRRGSLHGRGSSQCVALALQALHQKPS